MEDNRELTQITDHITACKFCGQVIFIKGAEDMTQEQIEHAAVMQCNCEESLQYQIRNRNAAFAKNNINEIFDEDAEALKDFLHKAVDKMASGVFASIKCETTTGVKAEVVLKKSKYKVTRTQTNKTSLES